MARGSYPRLPPRAPAVNHLAHARLAGPDPAHVVGGLLGDFWRGAPDPTWPDGLALGVRLHRRIDAWIDAHPECADLRALFPPPYRRYAGILLDVWFDHLLAADFERLAGEPLPDFEGRVRDAFVRVPFDAPPPFALFAARLARRPLLSAYAEREHVGAVLDHLARRLARANPVGEALPVLESLAPPLARGFARLWPELERFALAERARLTT